jgi:REP element-mobilizing transposase RayT
MLYQSIPKIVRWYKGRCSFEINKIKDTIDFAWQARYYDRIIRNERELENTRQYIQDNPKNWEKDELYL